MRARAAVIEGWLLLVCVPVAGQFAGNGIGNGGIPRLGSQRGQATATYVNGHVFLEDGGAIDSPIAILGGCRGTLQLLGYTDLKGNFSFDLKNTAVSQDAEFSKTQVSSVCEIRAKLDGYRSSAIDLASHGMLDSGNVGTILMHRIGDQEGTTVSMTSLMAPKDAKRAFDKGLALGAKGHTDEAAKLFQKAVEIYPQYADAWYRLGDLQVQGHDETGGRESLLKAIAADPKLAPPYVELAGMSCKAARWREAAEYAGKAIRLDPFGSPAAYYFDALANYNLENWDASERSARQVKKLDTQHRFIRINRILGALLMHRGNNAGAAAELREYLKLAGRSNDADEVRAQLAELDRRVARAER